MQKIIINTSRKYRFFIYRCLVFLVSCVVGAYFHNSILIYFGIFLIFLSIFFEMKDSKSSLDAIILPCEHDGSSLKFIINGKESDFWVIKKNIIINRWIYLYAIQQGSNKKLKTWLHKSNFANQNDIKDLSRYILFSSNN